MVVPLPLLWVPFAAPIVRPGGGLLPTDQATIADRFSLANEAWILSEPVATYAVGQ